MSQLSSEGAPESGASPTTPSEQFFHNATMGLNHWWRWVLGLVAIIVIYVGVGAIGLPIAGCQFLRSTNAFGLGCSDASAITGDGSLVFLIAVGGSGFAIGLLGIWAVLKLIHKKSLLALVTGRRSFGFSRYFVGMLVALFVSFVLLLADRFILQAEVSFQAPDLGWGYLLFLLFALALIPIQSGTEEVFYRGYILQGAMLIVKNKLVLAVVTGFLFALAHISNPEAASIGYTTYLISLTASGAFFAILTLLDGGLELAMGYHAVNNLFLGIVANTEVAVFTTPSLFIVSSEGYALFPHVFIDILGFALALLLLNHKYKWFKLMR